MSPSRDFSSGPRSTLGQTMAKLRSAPPQTRAAQIMAVDDDEEEEDSAPPPLPPPPPVIVPPPKRPEAEPEEPPSTEAVDQSIVTKPKAERRSRAKPKPKPETVADPPTPPSSSDEAEVDQRAPGTQSKPYKKRDGGKMIKWSIHATEDFVREYKAFAANELFGKKANEWAVDVLREAMRGVRGERQ